MYSLLVTPYSLLQYSLLYSLLVTPYSLLLTRVLATVLVTPYSLLPTRCSPDGTMRSCLRWVAINSGIEAIDRKSVRGL
ncbi:hypothetical protein BJ875DRAFT_451276 [Amylocarpus encephaloides]|uniref:Uncharacterized protein n=1 Tax=Amylocarpus encephaloides TaxID=45428 RepID=A0A9P8C8Z2_9HELO|nr:hypothetical protein BJ875DRAFT_451276 [Amylocarpus encephaloides]